MSGFLLMAVGLVLEGQFQIPVCEFVVARARVSIAGSLSHRQFFLRAALVIATVVVRRHLSLQCIRAYRAAAPGRPPVGTVAVLVQAASAERISLRTGPRKIARSLFVPIRS